MKAVEDMELARQHTGTETEQKRSLVDSISTRDVTSMKSISIIDRSTKSDTNVLQISGGQQVFASVTEDGKLLI
ncbi:hypothetical protein KXD40_009134 [Peronospora effusa]|uniref:Uncharacterized protein n=1 Tax=Peronospora effusa TaxID=542832 RepID=A0A3M6VPB4_9STRA|nr:hypothetical protein DD238_007325 [Peronospora effusa]RQM16799.1 hypothetical protein DD237_000515 [Peronospora effusa]UIZ25216.1 hypothetical protein KXD40_009134 [Peronospora effusa]